jgi:rhodanese-related sulfurtransferase
MSTRMHATRCALAGSAAALAVLAAISDAPVWARVRPSNIGGGERADMFVTRTVDALQVAAWIREGERDLRVLDLRRHEAYDVEHVPSAEAADFARLDTLARRGDAPVVLYSDDDVRDAQAQANLEARGHRRAYVLNGGMDAWTHEVMDPVLRGDSASYVAALSRYFGGTPHAAGTPASTPVPQRAVSVRTPEPNRGIAPAASSSDEFGGAPRRGC